MENSKKITYLYAYGDQHHPSSDKLKAGEKFISDGGSNIHTNFLLKIKDKYEIDIITYKDNYQVRNFFGNCPNIKITEFNTLSAIFNRFLLRIETVTRCFYPGLKFLFKKVESDYLITQTDFLPDTFSAFCAKIRNPKLKWIACFFLAAPTPWQKDSPYKGKRWVIGLFYWILQVPSVWLIKLMADKVMVTSDPDIEQFINRKRDQNDVKVVQGGVNIDNSEAYLGSVGQISFAEKKFDACFSGRFHYQKGVTVAIDIWREMCKLKPDAKLAMVGSGPLEADVKRMIKEYDLENNVTLFGFMSDGPAKYDVFMNSKLMIHPATYDSGGMASAEGMAWGLPAVSFNLEALKTYYPQGMIKTQPGDNQEFAKNINKLLTNQELYNETRDAALSLIRTVWDWNRRAEYMENVFLTND